MGWAVTLDNEFGDECKEGKLEQDKLHESATEVKALPAPDVPSIASRVLGSIGGGMIRLIVGFVLFVAACSLPLWFFFGGDSEQPTGSIAPIYAAPSGGSAPPAGSDDIGYGNEQDADDNCPTNDVIPLYRGGRIVGYACVVARY